MFTVKPVATVSNDRSEIKDDDWGKVVSIIELSPDLTEDAIKGIEAFSHLEIIFIFDKVNDDKVEFGARHPRNNKDWPMIGVFAQRGKNRPNKLGATIVKLIKKEGKKIFVSNLDAIDGTPIIDIKPVMKEFLPEEGIKQPSWSVELMKNYW